MNTLSAADLVPGIYTSFDRNGSSGDAAPNNRLLIIGMVPSAAPATLNTPFLATSQSQVDQQCLNYSQAAQLYKSAKAQPQSVGAEIWIVPVAEPAGGTKATHLITFLAQAGGVNTKSTQASTCEIDVGGQVARFGFAVDTLFADIAAAGATALAGISDLVVDVGVGTATITLTDKHPGEHGNDTPIRVTFSNPSCGVAASPGTATFASGPTTSDGSATLTMNVRSVTATLASGRTDTQSAVLLAAAVNGDASPVSASNISGAVTLYYRNDRYVHRFSKSLTSGVGPQTLTLAVGTTGAGVPDLTAAITNLTADETSYKAIVNPFTDTTSWAALATYVLASDATPIEKGQMVFGVVTTALPASPSSGLPQATSPALNTSELFAVGWYQGVPARGADIAAKIGAIVAAETAPNRNFNGIALRGSSTKPLGVPHKADRPTRDQVSLAISTYQFAPLTVAPNELGCIRMARTTFKSPGGPADKLRKWSGALLPIYFRASLRALFARLTGDQDNGGKNVVAKGEPQTADGVSPKGIKGEVISQMLRWGAQGLYDGAEGLKTAVQAGVTVSPNRIDVSMPFSGVADLDQIVIGGYLQ